MNKMYATGGERLKALRKVQTPPKRLFRLPSPEEEIAARWAVGAPVPKIRIQASKLIHAFAPIVAVCRALVLESDCASSGEYLGIVRMALDTKAGQRLHDLANPHTPIPPKFHYGVELQIYWALESIADAIEPHTNAFAERWLFNSPLGATQIAVMVVADVVNLRVEQLEHERLFSATWRIFNNRNNKNKERVDMRKPLATWSLLNDERLMRQAFFFVQLYHIYHSYPGVLDNLHPGEFTGTRGWGDGTRHQWLKDLRPFRKAFGIRRESFDSS